jgi:hypothetical protein
MKSNSWEFLLEDKSDAFNIVGWHSIELHLLRREESIDLARKHGSVEARRILKEREESIEERNRKWLEAHPPWLLEKMSIQIAEEAKRKPLVNEHKIEKKDKKENLTNIKRRKEYRNAGTEYCERTRRHAQARLYV